MSEEPKNEHPAIHQCRTEARLDHAGPPGSRRNFLREVLRFSLLTSAAFGCGNPSSLPPLPPDEDEYARLAFNESPFGPPPGAFQSMEAMLNRPYAMVQGNDPDFMPGINRYPDFLNTVLTARIGGLYDIPSRYVVPCCGISECIYMCSQAFLQGNRHLLTPEATYALPAYYAVRKGAEVRKAPMDDRQGIDLDVLSAMVTRETGIIYVANPNNPTGSLLSLDALAAFLGRMTRSFPEAVVLLDEAYADYVFQAPFSKESIGLVREHRLVVARTFSKAFGMAGLRAGYFVANDALVLILNGFLSGYLGGLPGWRQFEGDVNRLAVAALEGSLNENGYTHVYGASDAPGVRDKNAALRTGLLDGLQARGFQPLPSEGNFLFVDMLSSGENWRRYLFTRKILVQAGGDFAPGYENWIRVSVGSGNEIDRFLEALKGYDPGRAYPECPAVFHHGI